MPEAADSIQRPVTVDTVRERMHVAHIATIAEVVHAPADRVYRSLKAVAEGRGGRLEWAEVVERAGDRLLDDFVTQITLPGGRQVRFRTREAAELSPPHMVHYRHRSGPSRGVAETIVIQPRGASSRVIYRAVYPSPWRIWGWLFAFFAKPVAHLFMWAHFRELRRTLERPRSSVRQGRLDALSDPTRRATHQRERRLHP